MARLIELGIARAEDQYAALEVISAYIENYAARVVAGEFAWGTERLVDLVSTSLGRRKP